MTHNPSHTHASGHLSADVALPLVRQLLADALDTRTANTAYVRDLAGRIGELQQVIRAALTVIDLAAGRAGEAGQR